MPHTPSTRHHATPRRLEAFALLSATAMLTLLMLTLMRHVLRITAPAGSDPDLWVMSALNLTVHAPPVVAPAYPGLIALVHTLTGWHPVPCGAAISAGITLAIPGTTWFVARAMSASPRGAAIAAVLVALCPLLGALGLQVQPDSLTVLEYSLSCLAVLRYLRRPDSRGLAWIGIVAGTAPLIRDLGPLVSGLMLLIALVPPGTPGTRLKRAIPVALGILAAPILVGHLPGLPWQMPWAHRLGQSALELVGDRLPSYARELTPDARRELTTILASGSHLRVIGFNARHALTLSPGTWLWIGLGLVLTTRVSRGQALAALCALAPTFPALVVWSAPRHILPALPVAAALWVACLERLPRARPVLLMAGLAAMTLQGWQDWGSQRVRLQRESVRVHQLEQFGQALCRFVKPGDMATGSIPAAFLYCPLPRYGRPTLNGTAADWRAWLIEEGPPRPGFERVDIGNALFPVYRLMPYLEGAARPCQASMPAADTPYAIDRPIEVHFEPPCEVPPASVDPRRPADGQDLHPGPGSPTPL